jgi:NAD(P)-dependent dehydrogenase (short-subunit alcohol dehydrogenase family)
LESSATAVREAGGELLTITADITVPADARRMAEAVMTRFGQIDVLVNSAFGAAPRRHLVDMDEGGLELWRRTVEIGGYGTLLACRYVVPHMTERRRGAIVNVTSMSSRIGFAGRSEYAAGKAQAHRIAHALADELGPHGIRVNCVAPGHIWSERLEAFYRAQAVERSLDYRQILEEYRSKMALRRIVTNDEVASAVLFLSSELASGITGAILDVNAGQLFAP